MTTAATTQGAPQGAHAATTEGAKPPPAGGGASKGANAPLAPGPSVALAPTLDAEGQRVWTWLQHRRGHERGITAGELGKIVGWNGVEVREAITRNLDCFPDLVVASPAAGYFVAVTPEECEEYDRDLHSRGIKILIRRRRIRQHAAKCGFARKGRRYYRATPARTPGALF